MSYHFIRTLFMKSSHFCYCWRHYWYDADNSSKYFTSCRTMELIIKGKLHIDICTQIVIMTQIKRSPTSYYMHHVQSYHESDSFLKIIQISLTAKKVDYIIEELLNSHLNVGWIFFLFRLDSRNKYWRNYLIWTADWGEEQNTLLHKYTYFFSYQQLQKCI